MKKSAEYQVEQTVTDLPRVEHHVDVCVVGGGMAGLCAAIAAARRGSKVILVQDRPVLGGNASSEIRMWICGAHGLNNKETGILEEILLENCYRNPTQIFSIWDSVLHEKASFCPGLKLLLNTTCNDARMENGRLSSITAWQLTSQTWHTIHARFFIDCSGDSILAPLSNALIRVGRESREEFNEDIEPSKADCRTMGNSLLIQLREAGETQSFVPPKWAYKFRTPADLPNRCHGVRNDNFWWLEFGGLKDTIHDAEEIRDELMKIGYGIWDYLKNRHPKHSENEKWNLEWMGMLPGKRENRRYVGDHVLTQNDVRDGGKFTDMIAHGGWSMDDHHPAGLMYPGKPTVFHPAPSPYGIPFRSLYSRNVPNLLCAGRNISATHAALSSTRVMGTTSLLGQAAGTAAAMCVQYHCDPRSLFPSRIAELQQNLMDDDQWLPGHTRDVTSLTRTATLSGGGQGLEQLRDGHDRPQGDCSHAWEGAVGDTITLSWPGSTVVGGLRLVFDSDLNLHKRMPCSFPLAGNHSGTPASMIRKFRIETQSKDGVWTVVHREENNYQRLVRLPLNITTTALRLIPEETWGSPVARIFSLDVLPDVPQRIGMVEDGVPWPDIVARLPPKDLQPPESGKEEKFGG